MPPNSRAYFLVRFRLSSRSPVPSRRMGASWGLMWAPPDGSGAHRRDGTLIDYQYLRTAGGPGGRCAGA